MRRATGVATAVLVVALVLAGIVAYHASGEPDGLERVAADHGFADAARQHDLDRSPLADYGVRGIEDERASVGVAGVVGVLLTGTLAAGALLVLRSDRRRGSPAAAAAEVSAPGAGRNAGR